VLIDKRFKSVTCGQLIYYHIQNLYNRQLQNMYLTLMWTLQVTTDPV